MSKNDFKLFKFLVLCLILLGLASAVQNVKLPKFVFIPNASPTPTVVPRLSYIPQFVLISFDGSKSVDLWKDLRAFKEEMRKEGKALNFTHFINAAYFLTQDTRSFYMGPHHSPGQSDVGISAGIEDIRARIREINLAIADGDEIAPHTTGHFSGRYWSKEDWKNEFSSFDAIMFGLEKLYPNSELPSLNLKREDIIGFRAPYLDISPGLYETLHEFNYKYDTSEIGIGNEWPKKDEAGMWRIPLGTLSLGESRIPVLAMDYNLYVYHSNAADVMRRDMTQWQRSYDEMLAAWREYFIRNYSGSRAPVLMGYHFGQWNDGLYWEVMKNFTREVCGKPEVHCGTFKELIKYLEEYGVPKRE
jgi:hypothetical protein